MRERGRAVNFKSFDLLTGRKVVPELGAGKKNGEENNLGMEEFSPSVRVLNLRCSLGMWVGQRRG